jgi:predicted ATPase
MARQLDKMTIRGFKSFENLEDFELGDLNVLIGANGSGKSNFVEFFRVLRAMISGGLQTHVRLNGPVDGYFFNGVSHSKSIEVDLKFGLNRYVFELAATTDGKLLITTEKTQYLNGGGLKKIGSGEFESVLQKRKGDRSSLFPGYVGPNSYVWDAVSNWQVYHFHDTSSTSGMRREAGIEQSAVLFPDASNLAPFLLQLRNEKPNTYQLIRKTLQRIAPYFDDFELSIRKQKEEDTVRLTWRQKGKDYLFSPGHLSDGTIRFLCLTTALLQPDPPATIVVDEPELGLHPEAIMVLGGLIRSASSSTQIIIATQSPQLLSEFEPEQIITVDQIDGSTQLQHVNASELEAWLDDFSVGELWQKGNIHGGVNDA